MYCCVLKTFLQGALSRLQSLNDLRKHFDDNPFCYDLPVDIAELSRNDIKGIAKQFYYMGSSCKYILSCKSCNEDIKKIEEELNEIIEENNK